MQCIVINYCLLGVELDLVCSQLKCEHKKEYAHVDSFLSDCF